MRQLQQKNENVRVVVEGRRNTCRETERGTTAGAAWPEQGARVAFSSEVAEREAETAAAGGSRARVVFLPEVAEREGGDNDGVAVAVAAQEQRAMVAGIAERNGGGARARKKGGAILSPN